MRFSGKTMVKVPERLGDRIRVLAGMLNIVSDRLAIGTEVDHDMSLRIRLSMDSPGRILMYRLSVTGS